MQFKHVERFGWRTLAGRNEAFLVEDGWDDYTFQTLFDLILFDSAGGRCHVGKVKILSRGLTGGRVFIPAAFEELSSEYCSLGQDKNYYETLAAHELGEQVLRNLRDCVFDSAIFNSFRHETGFDLSLLRHLSESSVTSGFPSVLNGQATLTPFRFAYTFPRKTKGLDPPRITFDVDPDSMPPTNVHVVIGRNGVGKTHLLGNIAELLCKPRSDTAQPTWGFVEFVSDNDINGGERFANLIAITFSAFDPFRVPKLHSQTDGDIRYAYIGLRKLSADTEVFVVPPVFPEDGRVKELSDLAAEFRESLGKCSSGPRRRRWIAAIRTLATDPGFDELGIPSLLDGVPDEAVDRIANVFGTLSAGHRIVLLTVSRLVELVEERTLVLLDEPESHLHPPLLSSFIRVLSTLLRLRNGAALIATHSPVVLQEVPKDCVWLLGRSGDSARAERPEIETFGENVGVLTREVFGLEVTNSGFHQLIAKMTEQKGGGYNVILGAFNGQLGAEARAIVRALTGRGK